MSAALGYLLTWTCYGTWLHGDGRGSVDDEHNVYDTPYLPPSGPRLMFARAARKHKPVQLDERARAVVHDTILRHAEIRRWRIDALNVRTNHVHVTGTTGEHAPGRAVGQYKAWCTRRLREAGLFSAEASVWTRRSSTRYLWTDNHLSAAITYVRNGQGVDLLPPEVFLEA